MNQKYNELTPDVARRIIETVGGQGTPPEYGFQFFTAGLDIYLKTLEEEYLSSYINKGGSAFKMVVGAYGEGKTHFLYSIRELGWNYNFISSYISLNPEQTPFHKLQQVYKEIVNTLVYPQEPEQLMSGYEKRIDTLIKKWYRETYQKFAEHFTDDELDTELYNYLSDIPNFESISFTNATKEAFKALHEKREEDFSLIIQWLVGENPPKQLLKKYRIFEKLDKSTAFKMIRSLVEWIKEIGYAGIVILLDEAEQTPSMSSKQKDILLNNLRELIDECGHLNFKSTMWFYAVADITFLEGKTQVYEALRQRLSTNFDEEINPTGVVISLENIPIKPMELLKLIGEKLAFTYEIAYSIKFDQDILSQSIENISDEAYKRRFGTGYKRLFVQSIIKAFHKMRKTGNLVLAEEVM